MATRSKKTRTTRTKAELQNDFESVRDEVENSEGADRIGLELRNADKARVHTAIGQLSVEGAVNRVTKLNLDLQRTLNGVQEQLVQEVTQLEDVRKAVAFEKEELEKLYKIDVVNASLEGLINDYKEKEAAFSKHQAERDASWVQAEADRQKKFATETVLLEQQRVREKEQYEYTKTQERRRAEDIFQDKMRIAEKTNAEKQVQFDKEWNTRFQTLEARESELTSYKAQVEGFPELLGKEKATAVAIATNSLKKDLEHKFELERKDSANMISLYGQQIKSLEAEKTTLAKTVADLQLRLEAANRQVVEVASKAVEGASGQLALTKVQEVLSSSQNGTGGSRTKQ